QRIVAVSAFSRDRFHAANPTVDRSRVDVCHLGLAAGLSTTAPGDPVPSALIVGRMASDERYKGHDLLIELWPEVTAAVPGAVLRIVGDGDDRTRLQSKAASLNARGAILFLGRVDDASLAREYERCTAVVMPSRGEGFGLVFIEAMRAGRGCIGGHGSASEIIVDGETGFVVDPGDRVELRRAIVRMLSDRPGSAAKGG